MLPASVIAIRIPVLTKLPQQEGIPATEHLKQTTSFIQMDECPVEKGDYVLLDVHLQQSCRSE